MAWDEQVNRSVTMA